MDFSFFKIFRIFGACSSWAEKACEDNKISIQETVDLAETVAQILGIPLEIDFAPPREEKPVQGNADLRELEPPEPTQGTTRRPGE